MKFLIDDNPFPLLADTLKAAGHDAVRVRDLSMQQHPTKQSSSEPTPTSRS